MQHGDVCRSRGNSTQPCGKDQIVGCLERFPLDAELEIKSCTDEDQHQEGKQHLDGLVEHEKGMLEKLAGGGLGQNRHRRFVAYEAPLLTTDAENLTSSMS